MKTFVTGGTGFIGSHLVDKLIDDLRYQEIRCLVRSNEKWLQGKDYQKVQGDLFDIETLREATQGVDVIFHAAGRVKAPDYKMLERVNVDGTENLLRVAAKNDVSKIVVLSSLAAAGPSGAQPSTEDQPMRPESMYGRSKKQMEAMIHQRAGNNSSVTILRPAAVYGPREDQIYSFFQMANKRFCPIVGNGTHPKVSMVYVQDVVQGCMKAAMNQSTGVDAYFISGPDVYNWNRIRKVTETVLGKKTLPLYIKPGWVKKIAGGIEDAASFLDIYPVINREKANELILEWTCSTQKAQKELNFEPEYSLEEGISSTIHWYKKHHWL